MQKDYTDAEARLRQSLAIFDSALLNDWRRFDVQSLLGASLLGQQKFAEAENLMVPGYEGMRQRLDKLPRQVRVSKETTHRVTKAIQGIVALYEAWGKPEKAFEWRAKLSAGEQQPK